MSDVILRELTADELPEAAALLGRGLRDNPVSVKLLGSDQARRSAALGGIYGTVLEILHPKGKVLGAINEGKIIGVCALIPPGKREPSGPEKLRLLKAAVKGAPLIASLRAKKWADHWLELDAREQTHWFLGPVGIEPDFQRRGVGTALVELCCERVDAQKGVIFLRTDQPDSVPFFTKFAFKTAAETEVIDVPNWIMLRPAKDDSARWARPPSAPQYALPKVKPR